MGVLYLEFYRLCLDLAGTTVFGVRLPSALAVVRRLNGADDEYVLRLVDARAEDPFTAAAALAREPWLAWAEPDLVREYVR